MTLFTRREFIKSLAALAGAAGLSLPQIEGLQQEVEAAPLNLPKAESTPVPQPVDAPAGYIKINGEMLEVLKMSVTSRNSDLDVTDWGSGVTKRIRGCSSWEVNVTAKGVFPDDLIGKEVEFELSPPVQGFALSSVSGKGYVTQFSQQFGVAPGVVPICDFNLEGSGRSLMLRYEYGNLIEYTPPPEPVYTPPIVSGDEDESEGDYWGYRDEYEDYDYDEEDGD